MTAIEPVRKEVTVAASADHAFSVFTDGIDRWWPRQHHIGASPLAREILEPGLGGRWYAVCEDGTETDTGKVLAWDPPHRVVLSWQITADWQFDPNFLTEIEVTFTAIGPKETVVVLEHRNLERYGERAMELRNGIDAEGGWGLILQSYVDAAAQDRSKPAASIDGRDDSVIGAVGIVK